MERKDDYFNVKHQLFFHILIVIGAVPALISTTIASFQVILLGENEVAFFGGIKIFLLQPCIQLCLRPLIVILASTTDSQQN